MAKHDLRTYFTDLSLGEKDQEEKLVHKFRLVAELKCGDPVENAIIDFDVNGEPKGTDQTDERGKAYLDCEIHTNAAFCIASVKMRDFPRLERPVRITFLKPEKKTEEQPKITPKVIKVSEKKLTVFLTRVDSKGKAMPGKIRYIDKLSGGKPQEINATDGTVIKDFDLREEERQILFYSPEKPNELIPLGIPSLPSPLETEKTEKKEDEDKNGEPTLTYGQKLLNSFKSGYKKTRKKEE